jgi:tetratricopeptide (TPR) repeat protein
MEKILASRSVLEGERKQVSVLFADMKGSMELLANRDAEEARTLLDPVLELMMEAVHRYEGTVNQVMGDGIMALFGAPLALEDHAVRACYAALRMQEQVRRYADELPRVAGAPLQIPGWVPTASVYLGYAYALSGRVAEALPLLEQSATARVNRAHAAWAGYLSEAYRLAGRTDEAITVASRGLEFSRKPKARGQEAQALRALAEIASHRDRPDVESARAHYLQAMTLGEELGMRPLAAHCHRGIGTLYRSAGERERAREHLATAATRYRELDMRFWAERAHAELLKVA